MRFIFQRLLPGGFIIAAIFIFLSNDRPGSDQSSDHEPQAETAILSCQGTSFSYQFRYDSSGQMKTSPLFGVTTDSELQSRLQGVAWLSCFQEDDKGGKFELRFADTHYEDQGLDRKQVVSFNGQRVYFSRTNAGEISELVFLPGTEPMVRHVIRDLLSQLSVNLVTGSSQWESDEVDTNGRYLAKYERISSDRFVKIRREYLDDRSQGGYQQRTIIAPNTRTEFSIQSGQLETLSSQLALVFHHNGQEFARNEVKLSFERLQGQAQINQAEILKHYNHLRQEQSNLDDISGHLSRMSQKERLERNALGSDDWDSIVAQMDEDLTATFLKLKALFYLQPETCKQATGYLLSSNTRDPHFHNMTAALLQAGHGEAQEAMFEALISHTDDKSRLALIGQLGLFQQPELSMESGLRDLRSQSSDSELIQTINLALANIGRSLKGTDRHQRILRESLAELLSCDEYLDCINALHVMGNIGAKEVLAIMPDIFESPDPSIRATAVGALRFVDETAAEEFLLKVLLTDVASEVRKAAAFELGFRPLSPSSLDLMLDHIGTEESANVRLQILNSLSATGTLNTLQMQKLKEIAHADAVANVRQKASNILESM